MYATKVCMQENGNHMLEPLAWMPTGVLYAFQKVLKIRLILSCMACFCSRLLPNEPVVEKLYAGGSTSPQDP